MNKQELNEKEITFDDVEKLKGDVAQAQEANRQIRHIILNNSKVKAVLNNLKRTQPNMTDEERQDLALQITYSGIGR